MLSRSRLSLAALCALVAAAIGSALAGGAAAAPRACTAEDLEGTRAPAMLRDHGLDTQEDPLVAGTRYRVVVVQELAIGDNADPVDGSIAVTAPDGPVLQQGTANGRPVYDFTPQEAGQVRLVVSWEEEVGGSGSGDYCSASQAFDLPVLAPTAPLVDGRFRHGRHSFGSSFLLRLRGKRPQDPGKVSVILRARRGTTKPPAPHGHAFARFTFKPTGTGKLESSVPTRRLGHVFYASSARGGVQVYPYPNIRFGRTLRFAFSFEVRQNDRTLGGLSSGAKCRRIQFTGHSAVKCRAVGLEQRP